MTNTAKTFGIHADLLNFVRPSPHSTFSPSGADRWLSCSYSVNASKGIPEESSKYSEEGTVAHSVCEAFFRQQHYELPFPVELQMAMLPYDGDEMMECAAGYYDVIQFWLNNYEIIGGIVWFGLERGIPVFPEEGCFGTADCLIIGTKGAVVIDYKHGKGKNVGAGSLQLKVYAAGVARYLLNVPQDYLIHAVVYQPRTDQAPKETNYTMPVLNIFLGDIWNAIQASKKTDLEPVEGNHCFWCPASRTKDMDFKCKAIKEKPLKLAQENFGKFLADMNAPIEEFNAPNPKRDEAIIKIHALFPLMKKIVEDTSEELMMRIQGGEAIDGVRIIDEIGNRILNAENDKDAADLIKSKFGIEPWKVIPETKKLKTITEIEKTLGKNKLDSICVRKIKKKIDIADGKMRDILGEMATYGQMINNEGEV
jgi:hypothetical protein